MKKIYKEILELVFCCMFNLSVECECVWSNSFFNSS